MRKISLIYLVVSDYFINFATNNFLSLTRYPLSVNSYHLKPTNGKERTDFFL